MLFGRLNSVDLKSNRGSLGLDVFERGRLVELGVNLGLGLVLGLVLGSSKLDSLLRSRGRLVIRLNEEGDSVLLETLHRSFLSSSLANDLLSLVWRGAELGVGGLGLLDDSLEVRSVSIGSSLKLLLEHFLGDRIDFVLLINNFEVRVVIGLSLSLALRVDWHLLHLQEGLDGQNVVGLSNLRNSAVSEAWSSNSELNSLFDLLSDDEVSSFLGPLELLVQVLRLNSSLVDALESLLDELGHDLVVALLVLLLDLEDKLDLDVLVLELFLLGLVHHRVQHFSSLLGSLDPGSSHLLSLEKLLLLVLKSSEFSNLHLGLQNS